MRESCRTCHHWIPVDSYYGACRRYAPEKENDGFNEVRFSWPSTMDTARCFEWAFASTPVAPPPPDDGLTDST